MAQCAVCSAPAAKKCSRCSSVYYCTRDHQKSHWKAHKKACKTAAAASGSVPKSSYPAHPCPKPSQPLPAHLDTPSTIPPDTDGWMSDVPAPQKRYSPSNTKERNAMFFFDAYRIRIELDHLRSGYSNLRDTMAQECGPRELFCELLVFAILAQRRGVVGVNNADAWDWKEMLKVAEKEHGYSVEPSDLEPEWGAPGVELLEEVAEMVYGHVAGSHLDEVEPLELQLRRAVRTLNPEAADMWQYQHLLDEVGGAEGWMRLYHCDTNAVRGRAVKPCNPSVDHMINPLLTQGQLWDTTCLIVGGMSGRPKIGDKVYTEFRMTLAQGKYNIPTKEAWREASSGDNGLDDILTALTDRATPLMIAVCGWDSQYDPQDKVLTQLELCAAAGSTVAILGDGQVSAAELFVHMYRWGQPAEGDIADNATITPKYEARLDANAFTQILMGVGGQERTVGSYVPRPPVWRANGAAIHLPVHRHLYWDEMRSSVVDCFGEYTKHKGTRMRIVDEKLGAMMGELKAISSLVRPAIEQEYPDDSDERISVWKDGNATSDQSLYAVVPCFYGKVIYVGEACQQNRTTSIRVLGGFFMPVIFKQPMTKEDAEAQQGAATSQRETLALYEKYEAARRGGDEDAIRVALDALRVHNGGSLPGIDDNVSAQ